MQYVAYYIVKCSIDAFIITMIQKCHSISYAPHFLLQFFILRERKRRQGERERESANILTWKGTYALKLTSIICLETAKLLG